MTVSERWFAVCDELQPSDDPVGSLIGDTGMVRAIFRHPDDASAYQKQCIGSIVKEVDAIELSLMLGWEVMGST